MEPQYEKLEERIIGTCKSEKQRQDANVGILTAYTILHEYNDRNKELESTETVAKYALDGANPEVIGICGFLLSEIAPSAHEYLAINGHFGK